MSRKSIFFLGVIRNKGLGLKKRKLRSVVGRMQLYNLKQKKQFLRKIWHFFIGWLAKSREIEDDSLHFVASESEEEVEEVMESVEEMEEEFSCPSFSLETLVNEKIG